MWVTVCCVRLSRHDDRLMIGFPSRECCCDESRGHRLVSPASAWSVVVGVHKNKRKRNVSWRNNMAPNGDTRGTHKHKHKHKSPLFDSKDTTTNEQHATEAVPTAAGASVQRFLSDDEFSSSMNSFSFAVASLSVNQNNNNQQPTNDDDDESDERGTDDHSH